MKTFLYIFLSVFCYGLHGQNQVYTQGSMLDFLTSSEKNLMQISGENSIEGSPYLIEDYLPGKIYIDGVWYEEDSLKYDAYHHYFELKLDGGLYELNPNSSGIGADTVLYNKEVFVRKNMGSGPVIKLVYLSLLGFQDEYTLFKQYEVRMNEATEPALYIDAKPAEYKEKSPTYYVFKGPKKWEVKGLKSLEEVFSTEQKTIRNFLKENKYKISREGDLIEIVKYFAGLAPSDI